VRALMLDTWDCTICGQRDAYLAHSAEWVQNHLPSPCATFRLFLDPGEQPQTLATAFTTIAAFLTDSRNHDPRPSAFSLLAARQDLAPDRLAAPERTRPECPAERPSVRRTGRRDQRHVREPGVVVLGIRRVGRPCGGVSRPMPPDTNTSQALLEVAGDPDRLTGMLNTSLVSRFCEPGASSRRHYPLIVAPIFTDVSFGAGTGRTTAEVAEIVHGLCVTIAVNALGLQAEALP